MNRVQTPESRKLAERLVSEQNFASAVAAGTGALLLAAAAYGIAAAAWPFSHGFAVVGIGLVTGLSIGFLGRGISMKFAVMAAALTVAGCALGAVFREIMATALTTSTSPLDVVRENSLVMFAERAAAGTAFVDLLYWFVAVFCAVFLARRPLSRAERLAVHQFRRAGQASPVDDL